MKEMPAPQLYRYRYRYPCDDLQVGGRRQGRVALIGEMTYARTLSLRTSSMMA
jgi:hypothetical protein